MLNFVKEVLANMPADWLNLTTHRLDIYNEELAKTEFLGELDKLYDSNNTTESALSALPTAYDYIRLGHPLSCLLEWSVAKLHSQNPANLISFGSNTMPIMAVLRKNLLDNKNTLITYQGELPNSFDAKILREVYGYQFELKQIGNHEDVSGFDGTIVHVSQQENVGQFKFENKADFYINFNSQLGSLLLINHEDDESYRSEIQHVRRRETIAMTPANTLIALQQLVGVSPSVNETVVTSSKAEVLELIKEITGTKTTAVVASSGLSMQYAIVMGLIHDAIENHKGKAIKIIVPTNCYGGTNDQARRVAALLNNVEVVDLRVDGDHDMVQSIHSVLDQVAHEDAVPYIIAEIPTNPRVEVPNLIKLEEALSKERQTASGSTAIKAVFILDQTFCPNTQFLGEKEVLAPVKTIAYVSGSKFPSGGKCTAGYCTSNQNAAGLMSKIDLHLRLCDNEATTLQMNILASQMPSMNQRIEDAYKNTRAFVEFIRNTLPNSKIYFVSKELAEQGFTPSVFSLDLPTKGSTEQEKETYKREMNLKLINSMIKEIPTESKFCVSYGQLKGCYWTIPATSTQGTTKESDKDYVVRVSVSPNLDLEHHKEVFLKFVEEL